MSVHIFYHSADKDGHCSGAIANYFALQHRMNSILHPIDHGEGFPWSEIEPEDQVWMLDFSLPMSDMILLKYSCKQFIWIDHHIGRIREYKADASIHLEGLIYTNYAACELAWMFFYPLLETPRFVRIIGLYDRWVHNDSVYNWDFVESFQNGMKIAETDPLKNPLYFKKWIEANSYDENRLMDDALAIGDTIGDYLRLHHLHTIEKRAYIKEWEGYKCLFCSEADVANDLAESKMFKENGCQVAITYSRDSGEQWTISFRTKDPSIDLTALAQKYGGNGHRAASGARWAGKILPWDLSAPDGARGLELGFA